MWNKEWTLLCTAYSYDEAKDFVTSLFSVCQYDRLVLNNAAIKYSFKCSEYRKYPHYSYDSVFYVFILHRILYVSFVMYVLLIS